MGKNLKAFYVCRKADVHKTPRSCITNLKITERGISKIGYGYVGVLEKQF
jgi:hypothetical protein